MYMNEILDTERSLSGTDVREIELTFDMSLPTSVRSHYLAFNGGRPSRNLFKKNGEYFQIHEFLPMKYGRKGCRFEDTYRDLVIGTPQFPKHLVPFAIDPGGDYYCVSVRSNEVGFVYCYMHDYFDDPARSLVFMAPSITEFVNGMVDEEEAG